MKTVVPLYNLILKPKYSITNKMRSIIFRDKTLVILETAIQNQETGHTMYEIIIISRKIHIDCKFL